MGNAQHISEGVEHASSQLRISILLGQVIRYAPGTFLPAALALFSTAIFTRLFGAGEYGQYILVTNIAGLVAVILSQWLIQSVNRFLPEAIQQSDPTRYSSTIRRGLLAIASIVTIGSIILLFLATRCGWNQSLFLSGSFLVLVTCLTGPLFGMLQARMLAAQYSLLRLAESILKLGLALTLALFVSHTPAALVWGWGITSGVLLIPLWRIAGLAHNIQREHAPSARSRLSLREFLAYGIPFTGLFLASNLLDVGDRYVIQWLRGSAEVGIYAANYALINGAVRVLVSPLHLAGYTYLVLLWTTGERERVANAINLIVETLGVGGLFLTGLIYIYSGDLARFFLGPQFQEGHIIMPIIISGFIAWEMAMYIHKPLELTNRTPLMMALGMAIAAVNVLLNIIVIKRFGYIGAAYTTLFCYFIYALAAGVLGNRYLPWSFPWRRLIIIAFFILLGSATAMWIRVTLEPYGSFLVGVITGVAYTIICMASIFQVERGLVSKMKQNFQEIWTARGTH